MNYSTVTSPTWANAENTIIDAVVNFDALGEIPFSASPNDNEQHGREIFERCAAGEFGLVAPYVAPVPAQDRLIAIFTAAIQARLDNFAKQRGYDGILSACTYANSSVNKFRIEGQCCVDLRDSTWAAAYSLLADMESGARTIPTLDDLAQELPALEWTA